MVWRIRQIQKFRFGFETRNFELPETSNFECLKLSPPEFWQSSNLTFRNHLFEIPISQHSRYSMKQQLKNIYGQEPSIRSIVPFSPWSKMNLHNIVLGIFLNDRLQCVKLWIVHFHITVYNNSEWTVSTLDSEVTACLYLEYFGLIFRRCNSQSNLQLRQLCNSQPGRELPCGNSIPAAPQNVESRVVFVFFGFGENLLWVQSLLFSPQLSHLVQLSQPLANSLGSRVCKRSRCFWVEWRDGWMCRWQSWGNKRSTEDAVMEGILFWEF